MGTKEEDVLRTESADAKIKVFVGWECLLPIKEKKTVSFSHDFFVVARKPDVVTKEQLMLAPLKKSFFEQI